MISIMRSKSFWNFVRRMVSKGVAIDRLAFETARPMVFDPTSNPRRAAPGVSAPANLSIGRSHSGVLEIAGPLYLFLEKAPYDT